MDEKRVRNFSRDLTLSLMLTLPFFEGENLRLIKTLERPAKTYVSSSHQDPTKRIPNFFFRKICSAF